MATAYDTFATYNMNTPQANPDTWVANVQYTLLSRATAITVAAIPMLLMLLMFMFVTVLIHSCSPFLFTNP